MREYVKTVKGFHIYFEAGEESIAASEIFSKQETGVNHSKLIKDIERGVEDYFCAEVSAVNPKTGETVAIEYLGACVYTPARSFITDSGYFEDMAEQVANEALTIIMK